MIFKIKINSEETTRDYRKIPFKANVEAYEKNIGKWTQNASGEWFNVIKVDIIEEGKGEVTIEKWDNQQFSPAHCMAYSIMGGYAAKTRNLGGDTGVGRSHIKEEEIKC